MNNCLGSGHAGERVVWMMKLAEHYGLASHLDKGLRCAVQRSGMECFSVVKKQMPELGLAQPDGVLEHCIENRFKLPGRRANDTQYVRCGCLLFQRLSQFIEQPRVLDGDDGLSGEILQQFNLLVGIRPNLLAVDHDGADYCIVLEHGNREE